MDPKTRLLSFVFVAHAIVHGAVLSIPLFVPIWVGEFAATRAQLGFAAAAMLVLYGGMAIPAGALSDRYGSDRFVTVYLLLTGVGFSLMLLVDSFPGVAASLLVIGLGAGLYHAPVLSLLSRQPYSSSRVFAIHNIGGNLGIALGPLIVIFLLTFFEWGTVLGLVAVPFLAFAVLFHVAGPTDTIDSTERPEAGVVDSARSLLAVGFVFVFAVYVLRGAFFRGTMTFLPDFLQVASGLEPLTAFGREIPPGRWVYSAILLLGVFGEYTGGELGERLDAERTLVGLFLVATVLSVLFGRVSGVALFAVAGLFGFVVFVFPPLMQALVAEYSPETSRGMGYGLVSGGNLAFGGFAGTSAAGWLVTTWSYPVMFVAFAALPLAAAVVIVSYRWVRAGGAVPDATADR